MKEIERKGKKERVCIRKRKKERERERERERKKQSIILCNYPDLFLHMN